MADGRLSAEYVETLVQGTSEAAASAAYTEAIFQQTSDGHMGAVYIEVLVTVVPSTQHPVFGRFGFSL